MAIQALNSLYVAIAQSTSGGTAPGGSSAPTGCTLTSATDISAYVTGIDQSIAAATQEVTTFGSGGFQAFVAGLKSGTLNLTLLNDYAAGALNALIGINGTVRAVGSATPLIIEVRVSSGTRSATNPGFVCSALSTGFSTFSASVGGLPMANWQLQVTGGFGELVA